MNAALLPHRHPQRPLRALFPVHVSPCQRQSGQSNVPKCPEMPHYSKWGMGHPPRHRSSFVVSPPRTPSGPFGTRKGHGLDPVFYQYPAPRSTQPSAPPSVVPRDVQTRKLLRASPAKPPSPYRPFSLVARPAKWRSSRMCARRPRNSASLRCRGRGRVTSMIRSIRPGRGVISTIRSPM
jgi:hypothetical protein